jgi:DNA invertase Pin-like site-specific DNA recombinase
MDQSMKTPIYVAYYRVSTKRQETSGAGLDAQRFDVENYITNQSGELLAEFTEIESGRKTNRPELEKALKLCKSKKAILITAKLDRLARNVHFVSGLQNSKIEFVACDNPQANKMMIQLLAVFAEYERDMISQRIKDALAQRKSQGVKLGVTGKDRARENKAKSQAFAYGLEPLILEMREDGIVRTCDMVRELNRRGVPTARGGLWHRTTVERLIEKIS